MSHEASGLGAAGPGATGIGATGPGAASRNALYAMGRDMAGRLLWPDDEAFAFAAWPNNARWAHVQPAAIAVCANEADVQQAMRWAFDYGGPFVVRSGGHSYAGFSTTNGLLIDVKEMNQVQVDLAAGTVWVQGGANNQDMAIALRSHRVAVPAGRCATVGVAGLVLGGGWGFSASRSGLTCDSLLSSEVILADTRKVLASPDSEPDLFWAMRGGGGGNFGVHTSFTFRLHKVADVTTFHIEWPPEKQVQVLYALQQMQCRHARQISTRTKARPLERGPLPGRERIRVETLGMFWGSKEELLDILAPVYAVVPPSVTEINSMDFWSARDYLLTDDPFGLYDLRSSYVETMLSEQALDTMLNWMSRWPGGSVAQENLGILFAMGGAVNDVAPEQTAYVHRNANFIFEMEAQWGPIDAPELVARQKGWLSDYFAAMQPFVLPQSYQNFANRDLPDWANAYYGQNLARLQKIKRAYDPHNLFRFGQSIAPA
jgi:hypothetical protein